MADMYHTTAIEIVKETSIGVTWEKTGKEFHLHIGHPCNDVCVLMDETQLNRLADKLRAAQYEHDIRTGPAVPVREGTTMAELKVSCDVCLEAGNPVEFLSITSDGRAYLRTRQPGSTFHLFADRGSLEALIEACGVALREQDISTGRVVPDDGDGLVPGGEPVRTCQHGQDVQTCPACQGDLAYKLATR